MTVKKAAKAYLSEEFIVTAVLAVVFLGLALYANTWPNRARLLPFWACVGAFVLLVILLIRLARKNAAQDLKPISWKVIAFKCIKQIVEIAFI